MSYGAALALQEAVFAALSSDATVASEVGGAIYDAIPAGVLPQTYVVLGPEEARPRGDVGATGAAHMFMISVVTAQPGFATAKRAAVAISDALDGVSLPLSRGVISDLRLIKARAARTDGGTTRQIDLRFLAHVDNF